EWTNPHDHAVATAAPAKNERLVEELEASVGGRIYTGDAVPVCLTWDDFGLACRDKLLPLLIERKLPSTLALSSRAYDSSSTAIYDGYVGTQWSDFNDTPDYITVANHSATHGNADTDELVRMEVETGLEELQAALPKKKIRTFILPAALYYPNFRGASPDEWATMPGRRILENHAFTTGAWQVTDTSGSYPMTGNRPPQGLIRCWVDGSAGVAPVKKLIEQAAAKKHGVIVGGHPGKFDEPGLATTSQIAEFLDWLVAEQEAGRVRVLTLEQWACAQYGTL
ncbi:polysaccharide deacetylase family protein, partial [Corynebacterium simulans]